MTPEYKLFPEKNENEDKIDEKWKYSCPLFNQLLHIPLWSL